ncbi:hypothetical protein CK203_102292 [Vitis vinifera]|uniref:Uncharacterized protein n=1 Tax=Vitis vinifera TaxID=29760 RepID=A0A438DCA2_VITVI|nr:hypothetical protein CK203_102292 [Vitis vinifera]
MGRARIEETWYPRPSHGHGSSRVLGHTSKERSSKGPSGKDGKGKDKQKEFTPRPIASYAMVHIGHGTALRGKL